MRKKGRYGFFWEPNYFGFKDKEKYLLIDVISVSLQSARRIAYKYVKEQGFSQGALWTISAIDEGDPSLSNKRSGIESAFIPLGFGIMPLWWLKKINSGWPRTKPFYHQPTYYDEAGS